MRPLMIGAALMWRRTMRRRPGPKECAGWWKKTFRRRSGSRWCWDNLSTHTGASLYKTFAPEKARALLGKLEFVYTPKHGSWLNLAECEFSVLSRQCLDRRIADIDTLRHEVSAWTEQRNRTSKPVEWRFTTDDARIKAAPPISKD